MFKQIYTVYSLLKTLLNDKLPLLQLCNIDFSKKVLSLWAFPMSRKSDSSGGLYLLTS